MAPIKLYNQRRSRTLLLVGCLAVIAYGVSSLGDSGIGQSGRDSRAAVMIMVVPIALWLLPGVLGLANLLEIRKDALVEVRTISATKWAWADCSAFVAGTDPLDGDFVGFAVRDGEGRVRQKRILARDYKIDARKLGDQLNSMRNPAGDA